MEQVLSVRSALLNAGTNLWQPAGIFNGSKGSGGIAAMAGAVDAEVNEALEQLLGAGRRRKVSLHHLF